MRERIRPRVNAEMGEHLPLAEVEVLLETEELKRVLAGDGWDVSMVDGCGPTTTHLAFDEQVVVEVPVQRPALVEPEGRRRAAR